METAPSADARFRRVYEENFEAIRAYCVRRVHTADVNDVVSDVFLVAWRRMDRVPADDAVRLWLYGVARNVVANRQRSHRRNRALAVKASGYRDPAPDGPEAVIVRNAEAAEALDALERLAPKDREIVRLRIWEELSSAEIGEIVGMKAPAVDMRLSRARKKLNRLLASGESSNRVGCRRAEGGEAS